MRWWGMQAGVKHLADGEGAAGELAGRHVLLIHCVLAKRGWEGARQARVAAVGADVLQQGTCALGGGRERGRVQGSEGPGA